MREQGNIRAVAELAPDYMGFIFYPKSKRFVIDETVLDLIGDYSKISKVGVFVNSSLEEVEAKIKRHNLNLVQLHGEESVVFCKQCKKTKVAIIKCFRIGVNFDFMLLQPYLPVVDYFLFDTQTKLYGGSGKTFNWQILENYQHTIPFFLSGGLSLENIPEIVKIKNDNMSSLDLNSCFEKQAGIKDLALLKQLNFNQIRTKNFTN